MKRLLKTKLIDRSKIEEELKLIDGTDAEYITKTGKIYKDYGDNKFYPKSCFENKHNGYIYCNIVLSTGKTVSRRVHILVANAFLEKPEKFECVMHLDNNKQNNCVDNLKFGTISENTKAAFADKLIINAKGFEDSQSKPVYKICSTTKQVISVYGSISIASKECGITKAGITYSCLHKIKTKPRCGFYFRYKEEYDNFGFIL